MSARRALGSLGLVTASLVVALLRLPAIATPSEAGRVVSQMIYTDNCTAPCFDGQSLRNATVEEVQAILSTSPMTRDTELIYVDEGWQQVIHWHWSDRVARQLTSDGRIIDTLDYSNHVNFREGRVWGIYLTFAISLDDLISTFGDPIAFYPAYPTRFGSEVFKFVYQNPVGYFEVWTLCEDPELSADNDVRAYSYSLSMEPEPYVPVDRSIAWNGYTADLPDCTVFRP